MYENHIPATYKPTGELEITKHDGTMLYSIPDMGISAGSLAINGIPVALSPGCSMFCSPERIIHSPWSFKNGSLSLEG